ncbi:MULTISPECIES: ATP-binding protein [unclassified Candidatus Paralachnospira]|uniref:ATP-binding protein n=1 Tax=unclassified Candidatus Paralachnospira TaxID=3099471 RepID=UPI003F8EB2A2
MRQIFLNIYGNSIKFTNPGGKISTKQECIEEKDNVITYRWTISDTGIGMSEEFLQHIFEPFSQEQADARSVYHGTGLGMSIVKKLVDKMGGMISVTSEIGKGSTFVIELPFEIASAPEKAKKEETDKKNNIHGLNLMLVEDNELNAEIAEMLLEDEGAIITMANDGQQAVELFNNNPVGTFDAILMDIMMPVMDGLAATKAIRSLNRPDAGTVPIIAMTANAFEEDVQKCLDVGMNAHLAKPLDIEKVKKTICEQIKIDCIKNNKCL